MIEISKKEDIIIPFDEIGEPGWETNVKIILDSITENYDDSPATPLSEDTIVQLEARLGTALPENLKLFYTTFGIADIGEQLQQLDEIGWIKDIWENNPYGPDFTDEDNEYLPYLVSFSDYLGNGNMFCFHSETKELYYYDHDTRPYITKMFDKVDDYIKGCLIFIQSEFFGDVEQKEVDEWAKDIVAGLFGDDIVEKWQY